MRMVALTEFAEERQPEHVFFCRPFFCDADTSRKSALHVHNFEYSNNLATTLGSLCTVH